MPASKGSKHSSDLEPGDEEGSKGDIEQDAFIQRLADHQACDRKLTVEVA